MSKYGIIVNADDCVGCHACFVACKEENQVAPGVKWNHLERLEHPAEKVIEYFRVSCMHCEDPDCMKVCPVKAVYFGPHGEVLIDQKKCIGCKGCLAACPYGAPKFSDPNKQSYYGDLKPLGGIAGTLRGFHRATTSSRHHILGIRDSHYKHKT